MLRGRYRPSALRDACGKFKKGSPTSTSTHLLHNHIGHYYNESSDNIASLAAELASDTIVSLATELAVTRAELDAKDSEIADVRAKLDAKESDLANANKKLCDAKAEFGRHKANSHKHIKAAG